MDWGGLLTNIADTGLDIVHDRYGGVQQGQYTSYDPRTGQYTNYRLPDGSMTMGNNILASGGISNSNLILLGGGALLLMIVMMAGRK